MPNELEVPVWMGQMLYVLTIACTIVWYRVIRGLLRGKEPIAYAPRSPVPWQSEGGVLAAFALVGASVALFAEWNASQPALPAKDADAVMSLSSAMQFALLSLLLGGGMVAWLRMQFCAKPTDFGWPTSWQEALGDLRLGALTLLGALVPVYAVQALLVLVLGAPSEHPAIRNLLNDPSGQTLLATALMAVVVAPLFEELAFRVLLQGWLERLAGAKRIWPIGVSSLAFALSHHGQGYAPVALFVLACFLGYTYRQTHRLLPCVVAHLLFNALSLALACGMAGGLE